MASIFWRLSKGSSSTSSPDGPSGSTTPGESSPAARQDDANILDAMEAVGLIMNDDIEGAEARLRSRDEDSTFHQLGLGLAVFMRSILGFEKEIMAEATRRLGDCEARAWTDLKKAQREADRQANGGSGSYWPTRGGGGGGGGGKKAGGVGGVGGVGGGVYPPGSEFALVHAEAQLMNAIIAVMSESLTEGLRGFYKLRKAFLTLNGIMEAELQYLSSHELGPVPVTVTPTLPNSSDEDVDQEKADDLGDLRSPAEGDFSALDQLDKLGAHVTPFKSTVDVFVHSGANMCFGMLLLVLSMVPPAFSRLLYVVGFKGDRQRGVRMLWQSTKTSNVNGACAGLGLLLYYNALFGFADIMPTERDIAELVEPDRRADETAGYPRERCQALLADMRSRYPDSGLWRLEEARVAANSKRLDEAIDMLQKNKAPKMRQIASLNTFELSMNALFSLRWALARDGFLRCVEVNDWSRAIYYYMAAAAELELYRDARAAGAPSDDVDVVALRASAEANFRRVPGAAGKKRFMTRTMPMEVFVARKLQKWEDRAKALGVELADAIGFSPALEMVYIWNGPKRMTEALLERALHHVAWDRCTAPPNAQVALRAEKDEAAIKAVSEATLLRCLGRTTDARNVVEPFLHMDRQVVKGPTKDDYGLAAAHYEVAAAAWTEASLPELWPDHDVDEFRRQKVDECATYLQRVATWETFVLDSRFSMRVGVGLDTVKWLRGKKNWA